MFLLFQGCIFRFYVSFRRGNKSHCQACGKLQASAVASCQGLAPGNASASVESGSARRVGTRTRKLRVEKVVMDRIGKPAHENFTSAVYLQVQRDFFCLKKVGGRWVVFENVLAV